jgi:hypothetical protein
MHFFSLFILYQIGSKSGIRICDPDSESRSTKSFHPDPQPLAEPVLRIRDDFIPDPRSGLTFIPDPGIYNKKNVHMFLNYR